MLEQAAILVGGLGTRLKSMGFTCPKPLVPVAGRPFVEHVIRHLASFGINRIVLLAGHGGQQVASLYDGKTLFGASLSVMIEPEPRGTGGAVRYAFDALDEEFLLLNGDSILLSDLRGFLFPPLGKDVGGRLLLREVEDAARYGTIKLGEDCKIAAFREKSAEASAGPQLISAGIYRFRKSVIAPYLPEGASSIEIDVFPRMSMEGRLEGHASAGYFIDIGLPDSYAQANDELTEALTRPAAFLDRDGVINIDHGYTHKVEDLAFTPTAIEGIRRLNDAGYRVIVVTNQAGIAKGHYSEADMMMFHRAIQHALNAEDAAIDAFYYCPYHPDALLPEYRRDHRDRKPGPGMFERAMQDYPTDTARSFLIGDRESDIAAAQAAGIPGYLIVSNAGDLMARVDHALTRTGSSS